MCGCEGRRLNCWMEPRWKSARAEGSRGEQRATAPKEACDCGSSRSNSPTARGVRTLSFLHHGGVLRKRNGKQRGKCRGGHGADGPRRAQLYPVNSRLAQLWPSCGPLSLSCCSFTHCCTPTTPPPPLPPIHPPSIFHLPPQLFFSFTSLLYPLPHSSFPIFASPLRPPRPPLLRSPSVPSDHQAIR